MAIKILPAGDSALCVEFGNAISEEINSRVTALEAAVQAAQIPGIVETVPTYRSLLICYDPCTIKYDELIRLISHLSKGKDMATGAQGRVVEIPVCYGGAYGEDLADVAEHAGLSTEEVVRLHSARDYRIFMLGFLPGFAYLGGMDKRLATPRLKQPRTRIPAGSVAIGGEQTGIYPMASPGGWRLIGMTPVRPYDPDREEPFLYRAGDYIRFVPVTEERYREIGAQVAINEYQCVMWEGSKRRGD